MMAKVRYDDNRDRPASGLWFCPGCRRFSRPREAALHSELCHLRIFPNHEPRIFLAGPRLFDRGPVDQLPVPWQAVEEARQKWLALEAFNRRRKSTVDRYAILHPRASGSCASCACLVAADRGPVGWDLLRDEPICDRCMLEVDPKIGAVLGLYAVALELGESPSSLQVPAIAKKIGLLFSRYKETFPALGDRRLGVVDLAITEAAGDAVGLAMLLASEAPTE